MYFRPIQSKLAIGAAALSAAALSATTTVLIMRRRRIRKQKATEQTQETENLPANDITEQAPEDSETAQPIIKEPCAIH